MLLNDASPAAVARVRAMAVSAGYPPETFDSLATQLGELDPAAQQQALRAFMSPYAGGKNTLDTFFPQREMATTATGQEAINLNPLAMDPVTGAPVPITGPLSTPPERPVEVVTTAEGMVAVYADGSTKVLRKPDGSALLPAPPPETSADRRAAAAEVAAAATTAARNIGIYGRTQNAVDLIDAALPLVSPLSAGFFSGTAIIGGTPAADLKAALDSINANLMFGELSKMREESESGGALGQIVVRELELLGAVKDSIAQAQSPPALTKALENVRKKMVDVANAYANMIGLPPPGPSGGTLTDPDTGVRFVSDGMRWVQE